MTQMITVVIESLIAKYLKALSSSEQTTRIGFALAFGAMPKFMLEGRVQEVVSCLVTASRLTKKEEKWVESRRCAIKALTRWSYMFLLRNNKMILSVVVDLVVVALLTVALVIIDLVIVDLVIIELVELCCYVNFGFGSC